LKTQIPLGGGYYVDSSIELSAQNCINVYPHIPDTDGALSKSSLMRTPGIQQLLYVGTGEGRGFHKFQKTEVLFQISGTQLIMQTAYNSTPQVLGTISGTGQVCMADNGLVLCIIVPGVTGYFYTISTGVLSTITDPVFTDFQLQQGGVTSVCEKDNRFIYTTDEQFFAGSLSNVNSGKDFDALEYEDAEVDSDPIVRCMEINNELYIFNSETIELYEAIDSTLTTGLPYIRISGATIDKGLKSRFSVVQNDRSFMFLGNGKAELPSIWLTTSGDCKKASTLAIDTLIQSYTDAQLKTVVAWSYSQDGHIFTGFNLPNETIVFDNTASANTGNLTWHIRQTDNSRWCVNNIVTIYNTVIVNDYRDGRIGKLTRDEITEYNNAVTRTFIQPYVFTNGNSFTISQVELYSTNGVGRLINDPSQTNYDIIPTIELFVSTNNCRSYNSLGVRELGKNGEYNVRQIWRRLGRMPRSCVFKFVTSSIAPVDYQRLDMDISGK
jgi:hypothetical protein